jgi:hypothetical protein
MFDLGSAEKKSWTKLNYAVELARTKALAKSLEHRAKVAHRMKHPEHGKALARLADGAKAEADRMKEKKEMSGIDFGAKDPPSAEELKAQIQKVGAALKTIRGALKAATSRTSRAVHMKQLKLVRGKLNRLKRLLQQHKGDTLKIKDGAASEVEESEETELSGPLDAVGGFISQRPIVSLLLAALAGAAINRSMR